MLAVSKYASTYVDECHSQMERQLSTYDDLVGAARHNSGRMSTDKTIKLKAEVSILKHEVGDEIRLSRADFLLIFEAFFAEIPSKYL